MKNNNHKFTLFFSQLIGVLSIYLATVECKSSQLQLSSHHQHPRHRLKYRGVKKASSHKPIKSPKSIVDVFKGLPADDIEFIRQLDKQFEKFGNNIRIKVEKENRTTLAKNSKRTIDGSLGWVESHPQRTSMHQLYFNSIYCFHFHAYSTVTATVPIMLTSIAVTTSPNRNSKSIRIRSTTLRQLHNINSKCSNI